MIQRVFEQAVKSKSLTDVIVATDDSRIEKHVKSFGGNVIMTKGSHQSGTDRCFEAMQSFYSPADIIINIQGDEPFIQPQQIDLVVSCFNSDEVKIATLVKKINSALLQIIYVHEYHPSEVCGFTQIFHIYWRKKIVLCGT